MFVRKKVTGSGTTKHYLVESRRDGSKVRQKVLCYLGSFTTADEALARLPELFRHHEEGAALQQKLAAAYIRKLPWPEETIPWNMAARLGWHEEVYGYRATRNAANQDCAVESSCA